MGILLAVDYERALHEEASSDDQVVYSDAVFMLAKSHPESFVNQLSWTLSDNPDELFFTDSALGPAACFHSRIWLESWLKTLGNCEKKSLKFLTGKFGGQTIIAIPLTVKPGKFVTCVEFPGQNVRDYNIPIVHQNHAPFLSQSMLNAILQQIAELFPDADCIDFRKVLLDDAASSKDVVQWQEDAELTHLCVLSGDWDNDLSQLSGKSTKKKLKKKKLFY